VTRGNETEKKEISVTYVSSRGTGGRDSFGENRGRKKGPPRRPTTSRPVLYERGGMKEQRKSRDSGKKKRKKLDRLLQSQYDSGSEKRKGEGSKFKCFGGLKLR